ncbi:MAG: lysostaphin resistance A-like protein [Candidatus Bruticola sp.]
MSGKRIVLVIMALALWLPLVVPPFLNASDEAPWQKPFHANLGTRLAARVMRLGEKLNQPTIQKQTIGILDQIDFSQAQNSTIYGAASLYYLCSEKQKATETLHNLDYEETNSITNAMLAICKTESLPVADIQKAYFRLNLEFKEADQFYGDTLTASYAIQMLKNNCQDHILSQEMETDIQSRLHQADKFINIIAVWTGFLLLSLSAAILLGLRQAYAMFTSYRNKEKSAVYDNKIIWKPIPVLYLFTTISWINAVLGAVVLGLLLHAASADRAEFFPFALFITQFTVYAASIAVLMYLLKYVSIPTPPQTAATEQEEETFSVSSQVLTQTINNTENSIKTESINWPTTNFKCRVKYFAQAIGLQSLQKEHIFLGMAGFIMAILTAALMSTITSIVTKVTAQSINPILKLLAEAPTSVFIMFFFLVISGPIYEEIIYRGLLFSGLRGAISAVGAATVSSLMFSMIHGDPQGVLILGGLGAVFCALRYYSGSLWPSIIAHSMWNCQVAVYVLIFAR